MLLSLSKKRVQSIRYSLTYLKKKVYAKILFLKYRKKSKNANHRGRREVNICSIKSRICTDPTVPFNQTPCKLLRVPSDFNSQFPRERASAC